MMRMFNALDEPSVLESVDPERVRLWGQIQLALAFAHELAHCVTRDELSVAESFAAEFAADISPLLAKFDRGHDWPRRVREFGARRIEAGDEIVELEQELDQLMASELNIDGEVLGLDDRLKKMLTPMSYFGEEIVCDALAAGITVTYFEKLHRVPLADIATACSLATHGIQSFREIDSTIISPFPRRDAFVKSIFDTYVNGACRRLVSQVNLDSIVTQLTSGEKSES